MVFNVKNNLEKYPVEVKLSTDLPSRKVRLIDRKTGHHLLRVDHDIHSKEPFPVDKIINDIYDAVVISDYGKGYVTYELLESIAEIYSGPVYVDTKKKDLGRIKGCFVKVNEQERNECTTVCDNLIVTLGDRGTIYENVLYEADKVEVSDVCGAGDTFLAALVYHHLRTSDIRTAIRLANKAAAVTVQHLGTYAPSLEEYYEA